MIKKLFGFKSSDDQKSLKPLTSLVDLHEPAWPLVQDWIAQSKVSVEVLPTELPERQNALLETQVTTRSPMGAIIYETGGLLVDGGWLRILGASSDRMARSLPGWNRTLFPVFWKKPEPPPLLVVADDIAGGLFAVNGGALGANELGKVFYFAPDTLIWASLDMGYSEFLQWVFAGGMQPAFDALKWKGWEMDVKNLAGDRGFTFYPFLCAKADSIESRARKEAPLAEICRSNFDLSKQMHSGKN